MDERFCEFRESFANHASLIVPILRGDCDRFEPTSEFWRVRVRGLSEKGTSIIEPRLFGGVWS